MAQEIKTLPTHLAIIPDGNRRWAKEHGVPALEGHRRGAEAMHNVVDYLIARGIKYLTVWGFSTDNWKRSRDEVEALFALLATWMEKDVPWLNEHDVELRYIGRIGELPQYLKIAIRKSVALTFRNSTMSLALAFNYGGRAELIDAMRRLIDEGVPSDLVNEKMLRDFLYTDGMPDVDLVIRTAGEYRISNFLLWQTAYSEFYFTELLWPDFNTKELEKALQAYNERQRRFGGD